MSDTYAQDRATELQTWTQDRTKLSSSLRNVATMMLSDLDEPAYGTPPVYVAATGFDFSEFGATFADAMGGRLCGVACLSTEICNLPFEERVFSVPQHYIEPIESQWLKDQRALLYAQSIIADKGEVLTILSRVVEKVGPKSLTVASVAINADVKCELETFLGRYFEGPNLRFVGETLNRDLRKLRSDIATCLDDREVKRVPIMSPWLLQRRFGPDPKPELRNGQLGPGW